MKILQILQIWFSWRLITQVWFKISFAAKIMKVFKNYFGKCGEIFEWIFIVGAVLAYLDWYNHNDFKMTPLKWNFLSSSSVIKEPPIVNNQEQAWNITYCWAKKRYREKVFLVIKWEEWEKLICGWSRASEFHSDHRTTLLFSCR